MSLATRSQAASSPKVFDPFDRLFGNSFLDILSPDVTSTVPSVNIKEKENEYCVEMAVPGMKKEDFNIELEENVMTISCEKESENEEKEEGDFSRREYNYSSFSRSFTLPKNANGDQVTARYEDGMLHVNIAKQEPKPENKGKKINIQ